ncbi:hypothetical protein PoB_002870500 [Plakobranchus ocellatus]|uniref:Uncharacterized protein n=1 Tax=Plakobranchus ocellatus TaxID=259542 RepID=A0AAV4A208_9GAST|nr:hypothetical protein PoB_002870500 [Plakobranchus ocellatus]
MYYSYAVCEWSSIKARAMDSQRDEAKELIMASHSARPRCLLISLYASSYILVSSYVLLYVIPMRLLVPHYVSSPLCVSPYTHNVCFPSHPLM